MIAGLFWAVAIGSQAQTPLAPRDEYARGYLDALLDSRFSGLGIRVASLSPDGTVTLGARTCLGPAQRRDIERLLLASARVRTIAWDASTDCEGTSTAPESEVEFHWLPETELFAPLAADPRQPRLSLSYQRYRTSSQRFNAGAVALGTYFPVASGFLAHSGASQIGLQGAVFALFNLDAESKDLINADYWIGVPISYRRGAWSYLLRYYHQSSHLGDEFILGNPGFNRVNLSYEDVEGLVSYERERFRFYGGGGYIVSSEPDLDPRHLQAGVEYTRPGAIAGLDFFAAADVQAAEELDWATSRSYLLGVELRTATTRRTALLLESFHGQSPNGQFFRERLRYNGVGLYFGF